MITLLKGVYFWFGLLAVIWGAWVVFDDFYDVFVLGGLGWLIASIIFFPATVLLFPVILGIGWGNWGQFISFYVIFMALYLIREWVGFSLKKRGIQPGRRSGGWLSQPVSLGV